jgi:hypothetical protein
MIHSELWQSESIGKLTRDQRLLFIGLFSNADDQGRLRAHPAVVRSLVFPYDDISLDQISADLQALNDGEFITLYEADDKRLLQVVNWWDYQRPQWAYPSCQPAPDGWADKLRYRESGRICKENWFESKRPDKERGGSLPKALGKALGKDLPNGSAKALPYSHSLSLSLSDSLSAEEKNPNGSAIADDEDPPPIEPELLDRPEQEPESAETPRPQPPATLQEWIACLDAYTNHPALIRRMIDIHYPGHDPPEYSFIGGTAKKLGRGKNGYKRLIALLWQCSANSIKGDILPYILAIAKKDMSTASYYQEGHDQHSKEQPATRGAVDQMQARAPPSPLDQAWSAAIAELAGALGQQAVDQWLRKSALLERENGRAMIQLADQACVEWVSNRWGEQVASTLSVDGHTLEIEYVAAPPEQAPAWMQNAT